MISIELPNDIMENINKYTMLEMAKRNRNICDEIQEKFKIKEEKINRKRYLNENPRIYYCHCANNSDISQDNINTNNSNNSKSGRKHSIITSNVFYFQPSYSRRPKSKHSIKSHR